MAMEDNFALDEFEAGGAAPMDHGADGRADFDPAEAAARMGEALTAALAAEAGHAETINGSNF